MVGPILERDFYARDIVTLARDLLGRVLVRELPGQRLSGVIVETEAYGGADDAGSHAFRGATRRNRSMFGPPGHAYVYRIYGVHHCLNLVGEGDGRPGAAGVAMHDTAATEGGEARGGGPPPAGQPPPPPGTASGGRDRWDSRGHRREERLG